MTLTDAGPLIAILDRADTYHRKCIDFLGAVELPLQTTVPAFTEAMYFLGARIGWRTQEALLNMRSNGSLVVLPFTDDSLDRIHELMAKYSEVPMDFADASLVAAAEDFETRTVFTVDRHFSVYRFRGREPFEVLPPPG